MSFSPRTTLPVGRFVALSATAGLLLAGMVANAGAAHATTGTQDWGAAAQFVSLINNARAAHGTPRLAASSALRSSAASWAASMARSNTLAHNPHLSSSVSGWKVLGENVGVGDSVSSLESAFWASAGHRANMLDAEFTQLGVAVVDVGGRLWVAEEFMRPNAAATARVATRPSSHRAASFARRPAASDTVTSAPTAAERAHYRILQRAFDVRHNPGPVLGSYLLRERTHVHS